MHERIAAFGESGGSDDIFEVRDIDSIKLSSLFPLGVIGCLKEYLIVSNWSGGAQVVLLATSFE